MVRLLGRDPELEDVLVALDQRLEVMRTLADSERDDDRRRVEDMASPYALAFYFEIRRLDEVLGLWSENRAAWDSAINRYLESCYAAQTAARVNELAVFVSMSARQVSTVVSAMYGEPPLRVLRKRQLQFAATLLRTTSVPPADIATRAGFGTVTTFCRLFTKDFSVTPDEFRNSRKK